MTLFLYPIAIMLNPELHTLARIIAAAFDVLDDGYANDKAIEIIGDIEKDYHVRYILIDGENGQIESRALHESPKEVVDTAESLGMESYSVGMLLVPVL